jgi:hypothetical protein
METALLRDLSAQIKVLLEYEYAVRGLLWPGDGDAAMIGR